MPGSESLLDGLANPAESTFDADIFDITAASEHIHKHSSKAPLIDADDESEEEFKEKLTDWFTQMMFVSGETAEPSAETTGMIEELVRQQVIEMVSHYLPLFIFERMTCFCARADRQQLTQATALANRRGVRSISVADLIFLIRHDKAKVSRLRTFLSWKDVRKNVKDSDDKGGADAGDAADFGEDVRLQAPNVYDLTNSLPRQSAYPAREVRWKRRKPLTKRPSSSSPGKCTHISPNKCPNARTKKTRTKKNKTKRRSRASPAPTNAPAT